MPFRHTLNIDTNFIFKHEVCLCHLLPDFFHVCLKTAYPFVNTVNLLIQAAYPFVNTFNLLIQAAYLLENQI